MLAKMLVENPSLAISNLRGKIHAVECRVNGEVHQIGVASRFFLKDDVKEGQVLLCKVEWNDSMADDLDVPSDGLDVNGIPVAIL